MPPARRGESPRLTPGRRGLITDELLQGALNDVRFPLFQLDHAHAAIVAAGPLFVQLLGKLADLVS